MIGLIDSKILKTLIEKTANIKHVCCNSSLGVYTYILTENNTDLNIFILDDHVALGMQDNLPYYLASGAEVSRELVPGGDWALYDVVEEFDKLKTEEKIKVVESALFFAAKDAIKVIKDDSDKLKALTLYKTQAYQTVLT